MNSRYVTLSWMARKMGICFKKLKAHFKSRRIKPDFTSLGQQAGVGYYKLARMKKLVPELESVTRA